MILPVVLVVVTVVGTVVLIPSVEDIFFDFSFFGIPNTKIPVPIITKSNVTKNEITRIFLVFDISTLNYVFRIRLLKGFQ